MTTHKPSAARALLGGALLSVLTLGLLEAGGQRPADCNQDANVDLADAVCLLGHLFLARPSVLPCGAGEVSEAGNTALLDNDGSGRVNLSDAVYLLLHLFRSGPAPAAGLDCREIEGCPEVCELPSETPTYTREVQPLLERRCSPCHVGEESLSCEGGPCFASLYEDTRRRAFSCPDALTFECMLELVGFGIMPQGRGCFGDPEVDAKNPDCLTAEEFELLRSWVEAGGPE